MNNGKPYLAYRKYVRYDKDYFITLKKILDIDKMEKKSFITEHMLIDKNIMIEIINKIESNEILNGNSFYEKIMWAINPSFINLSGFSEYETYASYIFYNYREKYKLREWPNLRNGKIYFGDYPTEEQMNWISEDFCSMSIEHFDKQWYIAKKLFNGKFITKHKFIKIYKLLNPFIQFVYFIRMNVRKIVRR